MGPLVVNLPRLRVKRPLEPLPAQRLVRQRVPRPNPLARHPLLAVRCGKVFRRVQVELRRARLHYLVEQPDRQPRRPMAPVQDV